MKHASWIVVVALMALSGLATAQLASGSRVVAQVPFGFVVANKVVPAGQYEVQTLTSDGKTLIIRNAGGNLGLFSSSTRTEAKQPAAQYAMVFKHYGDLYFLSGIKLKDSKVAFCLPESRAEAELKAQNQSGTEEILLAVRE
jgi:hypothetical protein